MSVHQAIHGIEFVQVRSINQLMDDYQIPVHIRDLKLRHGEALMDRNLIYECIVQGNTPAVYDAIMESSNTFYKQHVYFNLPQCKEHTNITQELEESYLVSKSLEGYQCPKCHKTNTSYTTDQTRGCDEGHTVFFHFYDCKVTFKNPTNLQFKEKKKTTTTNLT